MKTIEPVLTVNALSKSFAGRVLFTGLNLRVEAGQFLALQGESGSGKSTLLNLIAGLDWADSGEIWLRGQRVGGSSAKQQNADAALRARHLGFVFQAFHLLPHLSLRQNVALPLLLLQHDQAEALQRADQALQTLGLLDRAAERPLNLSGGEQQRVALARALVHRPALVLADEPTGNLDPQNAAIALALLRDAARNAGAAVLMATHSGAAAKLADRRLRLTGQHLIEE